jgi:ribosome recycling factor
VKKSYVRVELFKVVENDKDHFVVMVREVRRDGTQKVMTGKFEASAEKRQAQTDFVQAALNDIYGEAE